MSSIRSEILILFLVVFLTAFHVVPGQTISFKSSISIDKPVAVSKDRTGHIYLANEKGVVFKLNEQGQVLYTFSPDTPGLVTILEAWSGLRILIFYADFQEFLFLDRFLNASPRYSLQNQGFGYYQMVTVSEDNHLWLIDAENLNLVKYDYRTQQELINTSLNNYVLATDHSLNHIKAYHQQIFIGDKNNGIFIFDNFGNYVKKLPIKGVEYFNFINDQLYFIRQDQLHFINLYNNQENTVILNPDKSYQYALIIGERLYLMNNKVLDIYTYKN